MSSALRPSEPAQKAASPGTMKALVQEGYGSADVLHVRDIARPELKKARSCGHSCRVGDALDCHSTHCGLVLDTS